MMVRPNPASGVPIYLQLMEQVKHAITTGALRAGEQLPGIRRVADELVMNANTVAKAYRELEHEGVIELRHGSGAFVSEPRGGRADGERTREALVAIQETLGRLSALGLAEEEIRRLFEGELGKHRLERSGR